MVSLLRRDDWGIGDEREMDPRVGHQVSLELSQVNIEGTIKSERGSDRGHNLANELVEVGVRGPLDIQVPSADVVDGFIVNHEGTVRVFQGGVGGQDSIVRLNYGSGNLGSRVDSKLKLGLLAVVNREPLHKKGGESGASASSKGVEDEESLETSASIGQLPDSVEDEINNFLSDGVVASSVVVSGILLSVDELFRMVKLLVGSNSGLVNHSGLQVNKDSSGDVFAGVSL